MLQVFIFVLVHGCFIAGGGGGEWWGPGMWIVVFPTWPSGLAIWFIIVGKNGDGGWQYIHDQMPKYYFALLLCVSHSKERDWKRDEVVQRLGAYLMVFKQVGGGPLQQRLWITITYPYFWCRLSQWVVHTNLLPKVSHVFVSLFIQFLRFA